MRLPSEILRKAFAGVGQEREYPAGSMIFLAGDPVKTAWLVVSGILELVQTGQDGREMVVAKLDAGNVCGLPMLFDGLPHPNTGMARQPLRLRCFTRSELRDLLVQNPEVSYELNRFLSGRIVELMSKVESLGLKTIRERLLDWLRAAARHSGSDHFPPPNQAKLAAELGTVREVVARQLAKLREEGILVTEKTRWRVDLKKV